MVGRILEAYIDCVPTASNLFHDLGGLKKATERLLREIEQGSKPINPGGATLEAQPHSPHGTLPYQRRNLIKFLMRDVAVSCYTQQVTIRPDVRLSFPIVQKGCLLSLYLFHLTERLWSIEQKI